MDVGGIDLGPERDRRSIVELLRDGVLDARLAATAWLLLERRTPIVVAAGPSGTGKTVLLRALLAFLPPDAEIRTVAGAWESWTWLPADVRAELGVLVVGDRSGRVASSATGAGTLDRGHGVIVVPEISDHIPLYSWDGIARAAIRLASRGYGLAATVHAESLADVLDVLSGPGVGASNDEISALGLVIVVRAVDRSLAPTGRRRVVAAHYLRPVARDAEGHVQRLDPAVLATWNAPRDAFDDFSWGVVTELAARSGMRAGDFEAERDRRAGFLGALVEAGVDGEAEVAAALRAYAQPPARA